MLSSKGYRVKQDKAALTHLVQSCPSMYACEFLFIPTHYIVHACVHACVTKLEECHGAVYGQQRSDVTQNRSQSNIFFDRNVVTHLKLLVSVCQHTVLCVLFVCTHEYINLTYVLVCCMRA